jgi:hypothetical protein
MPPLTTSMNFITRDEGITFSDVEFHHTLESAPLGSGTIQHIFVIYQPYLKAFDITPSTFEEFERSAYGQADRALPGRPSEFPKGKVHILKARIDLESVSCVCAYWTDLRLQRPFAVDGGVYSSPQLKAREVVKPIRVFIVAISFKLDAVRFLLLSLADADASLL